MLPKFFLSLLLPFVFFFHQPLSAQLDIHKPRLDSLFDALEQNRKCMGSIAIRQDGKLLYEKRIGFRDSTKNGVTRPDENTHYRIGSITKTFTAVMIIQLIEEGKLAYDTRLSAFYPEIPRADSITVQQMLNHHSGLAHYDRSSELAVLMKAKSREEVIKTVEKEKSVRADVAKGHYSNLNYILLGFIIEKITGTSLDEQLKQRIVGKAGLKNTYCLQDYISASRDEAHSFKMRNGQWIEDYEDHYAFADASGYMVSNPADLTAFMTALFNGQLMSPSSLEGMTKLENGLGSGLFPAPFYEKKGFGHTGRIDGFVSSLSYFPDDKLSLSLIINGQVYPMNDILVNVLEIIYNKPYTLPNLKTIMLSDDQLKAFEGKYACTDIPMDVTVKRKDGGLQIQIKQKGALFKQVMLMKPLSNTRFFYDAQGAIADFSQEAGGIYTGLLLRISGAKLHFKRK